MADLKPPIITENDAKDPSLLLRTLRKIVERIMIVADRVSSLEKAPPPPSFQRISNALQAPGEAPLNVTGLPGLPPTGPVRFVTAPSGGVLQQLKDTQLVLVGSSSTGFSLNTVYAGNPNTLFQLTAGLSTASVLTTSTNLMTLDTVQTSTGNKTLTGTWTYQSPISVSTGSVSLPGIYLGTDTASGIYTTSSGKVSVSASGNAIAVFSTTNITVSTLISGTHCLLSGDLTDQGTFTFSVAQSTGKFTKYNNDTLVGNGIPTIVAMASGTGLSGTSTAVLFIPPALGRYRVSYYLYTQTTGLDTIAPTFLWTDALTSHSAADTAMPLTANNFQYGRAELLCATSTSIRLQFASAAGTGTYSLVCTVERLS